MLDRLRTYLGTQVDNSPLVFFRICYGFLVFAESAGAIVTGWVDRVFIDTSYTFTFIGFEWMQALPGYGMYIYYGVMAISGICIMLGFLYRPSAFVFFVLWTGTYLMQKSSYNNHYYLLILLSAVMVLLPAHRYKSMDVRMGRVTPRLTCARICTLFFIGQLIIVYTYASINKIYPAWLAAEPISIWFKYKEDFWLIGGLLQEEWLHYFVSYGGILYDGLIVWLLIMRRTRWFGFFMSVFFNLFNSVVFHIGIFPYLMIALSVLFFPPKQVKEVFFPKKPTASVKPMMLSKTWMAVLAIYFIIQIGLPLRHYFYEGDVHWTEEGHRMSWQMMLYSKSAFVNMYVVKKATGEKEQVDLKQYLSPKQINKMSGRPDMIWQFAQYMKKVYYPEDIEVYAVGKCRLNKEKFRRLVRDDVDLASVKWERFSHSDWIITYD